MKTKTSLVKQLQTIVAVLGLAACGTGIANANDLVNPDVDLVAVPDAPNNPPTGWTVVGVESLNFPSGGFGDGEASEPWCNVQQDGGYGIFFKPFSGSTNADPNLDNLCSVYVFQEFPSSVGTKYTFSGYASCEAGFCGLLPAPPSAPQAQAIFYVEFLDGSGNGIVTNVYDLISNGMSTGGTAGLSSSHLTTPQYTAPAGTATVRAGLAMLNAYSTSGAQSMFADAFDLESVAPPGSPVITSQPGAVTVAAGGNTSITVGVTGATSYVWSLEGAPVVNGVNGIGGQGTATLTVTGASTSNVGHYRVVLGNATGTVFSTAAPLALNGISMFPVVSLYGKIGDTYAIERSATVNGTYVPFSTNKLTMQPQYITDTTLPISPNEFYKEVFLY